MHSHASNLEVNPPYFPRTRMMIALLATAATVACILLIKPTSLAHFAWYFCAWNCAALLLQRDQGGNFALAFLVNSAFTAVYVLVQSSVFPDSYGTTSPLSATWTDDYYFFAAVADSVPSDIITREEYWLYEPMFTKLIRAITPMGINHPLDALFFQSGTAALLATSASKFMLQVSRDRTMANHVFVFAVICPFLLMNGGAVLLRDTLTAALFIFSLCCLNERRFVSAVLAIALHALVRPGTAMILMFAYPIIYFVEISAFASRRPYLSMAAAVFGAGALLIGFPLVLEFVGGLYQSGAAISLLGRELYADLTSDSSANTFFLAIQELPLPLKLVLNAAYFFVYPFLSVRTVLDAQLFDLRSLLLNIVAPVYSFWLNAWFFAGALRGKPVIQRQREILVALAVILILVGLYSLQTRHKTIVYPLYYILIAVGFSKATPISRRVGYALSAALLLVQLAMQFR
jgi:hypothetical protein